ncbi:hypothetical protein W59_25571 [Rhodococcus opacus RKJ300 = JCM 13270]|uniref:Uncharacterized protein n=1 Tax=Rhodococcus opacus RKJ300 = JCM 13270 TaxID=1165867 RepID=I0WKP1_RHOOP|nr:hypothetical protein W59_25571 [Rhodococcus opacus RKJ300 = JCM 13270]
MIRFCTAVYPTFGSWVCARFLFTDRALRCRELGGWRIESGIGSSRRFRSDTSGTVVRGKARSRSLRARVNSASSTIRSSSRAPSRSAARSS